MKKTVLLNCLLLVLFLSSCGDMTRDTDIAIPANPTLATFGNTSLSKDQQVWFWADAESTPLQEGYFNAWLLTVDDDQGHLSGSTKHNYPKGNQTPIDLYGIHGDFDPADQLQENNTLFPTEGLTFKIETDQRETDDQGNCKNHDRSDLLYSITKEVQPKKGSIDISFVHMLSNIKVALRADANSSLEDKDIQGAVVRILGVKTTGKFTPRKISQADLIDPLKRAEMLSSLGGKDDIQISTHTVKKGEDFSNASYGQAIVIPQEVTGNWMEVTVAGVTHYYNTPFKFESGKSYQFNVTVSDILMDVQCQVTKWTDGGSEPVDNHVCQPGDYFYRSTDGTWAVSRGYPNPVDNSKGTCIGVVVMEGKAASDQADYNQKDGYTPMDIVHGYAVALFDSNLDSQQKGQYCTWSNNTDQAVGTQNNATDFMGYYNTQAIEKYDPRHGGNLKIDFPACYWTAIDYEKQHHAPDNSSGWFLPSEGQLKYLYDQSKTYIGSLTQAGGFLWQQIYWSSSEDSNYAPGNAFNLDLSNGKQGVTIKTGASQLRVRAIIAF